MAYENAEADRMIANLIEYAEVIAVNPAEGTAQVKIGSDLESPFIPWLSERAGPNHSWWPLEVGEWVVIACPGGNIARAVILGSVPTGRFPPHGAEGVWRHSFADGSYIEFSGGNFTIKATGNVKIEAARIDLN
jgi:phage baseplate assembly protein V